MSLPYVYLFHPSGLVGDGCCQAWSSVEKAVEYFKTQEEYHSVRVILDSDQCYSPRPGVAVLERTPVDVDPSSRCSSSDETRKEKGSDDESS